MSIPLPTLTAVLVLTAAGAASAQVTFTDLNPSAGAVDFSRGRGAALVDLDGDGRLDIVTCNSAMPNSIFRQLPDGRFKRAHEEWRIDFDDRSTWGVLAADFDNDGDTDLYFINGGFNGAQANQLLRNDLESTGVFTDVSRESGDAMHRSANFGGTALDFDRDGKLDIFLTTTNPPAHCLLLRNDGDLVFTDVSLAAGIIESGNFRHCSSGDYDNDGWMDIAVGNEMGANLLYRNQGDGSFVNVASEAGVDSPLQNFGLVLEDFDNDGWLDLYVPKYQIQVLRSSQLYRNARDGTFLDVTRGSGMTGQADMGHATGDVDSDGYPDIYIGTGSPGLKMDDRLFLVTPDNQGGFAAIDVSESSGILANGPTRSHGIVFGDIDRDGDIDVYTSNGGVWDYPGSLEDNALWENQGNSRHWTAVHLTGVISNRTAVGAHCVAFTGSGREIHRVLKVGHGFASTSSPIQHFGLESEGIVDRIEITWPSGIKQTIFDPPVGAVTEVREQRSSDVDSSGIVDFGDLLAVLRRWGPCSGCASDIDLDGRVDLGDLAIVLSCWGEAYGGR